MSDNITDLDVVALLRDLPEQGLERGQTGTVVLTHGHGEAYEVEFISRPVAVGGSIVTTVLGQDLLKLKTYKRVASVAAT